jgi:thiosulfate/3-mercaptopyruvate sulfurtransferase
MLKISPIINAKELQNLEDENLVIIDAGNGDSAYENYLAEHLNNSLYVDLKDLAEIPEDAKNGGRHPLPSLEKFAEVLQNLGIDQDSHVIIYDHQNGANAAARFWWMLRSIGVEKVQVLEGGFHSAKEKGLRINSEIIEAKKVENLSLKEWKLPRVDLNFIAKNSENPDYLVIDVREKDRFDGKSEPIDEIAGHIPGAINIPYRENLNEDGTFKDPEILRRKYEEFLINMSSEKIAIHCGSGVTACQTLLALDYAGFEIPNLYVGSWSEWSRNDKPVVKNN